MHCSCVYVYMYMYIYMYVHKYVIVSQINTHRRSNITRDFVGVLTMESLVSGNFGVAVEHVKQAVEEVK